MLELDKVDSLSDFLLIARFDLMGFVFVDSVTDLLLKNFRISSVLLSSVLYLVCAFVLLQAVLVQGEGAKGTVSSDQVSDLFDGIFIIHGIEDIGVTRSGESSCSSGAMEVIIGIFRKIE